MSEDVAVNMTLDDWIERCGFEAEKNGWHDRLNRVVAGSVQEIDHLIAKTALVGCEVAEAIEELRKGYAPEEVYESEGGKPEGFGVELADVVIRVLDLAYVLNLDLTHLIDSKLKANRARGRMHGGKKV